MYNSFVPKVQQTAIQAKATRTAGSNAENQMKNLEPYLGNMEGN